MYDELAMRFDLLSHKLDEMQKKYQDAQEEIKILKSSKSVAAQKDESTVTTETTSSKEGTSTLTGNPVKITNKMVFASQTSKSAVENIVTQKQPEGKKVLSIDELLTRKTTPAKQPTISITQKPSEDIYTLPKVEPKTEIKQEPRVDLADLLKKDIEYIDSVKSTTDTSATAAPTQSLIKNDLKEELTVNTEEERMQKLQEKIRALGKGISYGGVSSLGAQDPDEQLAQ
jgi:hypothetical protein